MNILALTVATAAKSTEMTRKQETKNIDRLMLYLIKIIPPHMGFCFDIMRRRAFLFLYFFGLGMTVNSLVPQMYENPANAAAIKGVTR